MVARIALISAILFGWPATLAAAEPDLSDPRLDLETIRREAEQYQELMKEFVGRLPLVPRALGPAPELDDPKLDPRIKAIFQERLKNYEAELAAYEKEWADERTADPLFDFKVRTALLVAMAHVDKLMDPRHDGFKCTDPREYERCRSQMVAGFQTTILKEKFNLDWSPPPPEPAITVWDRQEFELHYGLVKPPPPVPVPAR